MSVNCGNYTISGTYASGYEFSSWSRTGSGGFTTSSTSTSTTASSSTASTYFRVQGAATITLTGKASKLYMQNMTYAQCTTTAQTVYDNRDETAYVVQRLSDNKCWMLENLALSTTNTLTSSNTNLSSSWALPSNVTSGFNSYTVKQINSSYKTEARNYAVGQSGSGKVGVYYNYCAASAGTVCMSKNDSSTSANYDICPSGWRIPTGGSNGEYKTLRDKYSSDGAFATALRLPLPGYFTYDSRAYYNANGFWWSSTYYYWYAMYILKADTGSVDAVNNGDRYAGFSMRCVLKATF